MVEENQLTPQQEYENLKANCGDNRYLGRASLFTTALSVIASGAYFTILDNNVDGVLFGAVSLLPVYIAHSFFKKAKKQKETMKNLETKI